MRLQLLPSSFDDGGRASARQHLSTFVIDDRVSIDAGSLGFAASDTQRELIRDIVLTHAHLDHIAGLPLFIDDLFSDLKEPVRIHAVRSVIDVLEEHIFNWKVYPRFSELENNVGPVVRYFELTRGTRSHIAHLMITPVEVNHLVPSTGFIIEDDKSTVALSGDTAEPGVFWETLKTISQLSALLIECAFPNDLGDLARSSYHMTPERLNAELSKFARPECPIYIINIKPSCRGRTVAQLDALQIPNLRMLEAGRIYEF